MTINIRDIYFLFFIIVFTIWQFVKVISYNWSNITFTLIYYQDFDYVPFTTYRDTHKIYIIPHK